MNIFFPLIEYLIAISVLITLIALTTNEINKIEEHNKKIKQW